MITTGLEGYRAFDTVSHESNLEGDAQEHEDNNKKGFKRRNNTNQSLAACWWLLKRRLQNKADDSRAEHEDNSNNQDSSPGFPKPASIEAISSLSLMVVPALFTCHG